MERLAIYVCGIVAAFWLGALADHIYSGCGSNRCFLRLVG